MDDALQLRLNKRGDEILDRLKTLIQIYRSHQSLKGSAEIGRALPAAALSFTTTDEQILPQAKLDGEAGQGLGLHQSRPQAGEISLTHFREAMVKVLADDEIQYSVAQELQALVILQREIRVFVDV